MKVDAILCGDVHLQLTTPIARTEDEFALAMWEKLEFINSLGIKHKCPILCTGDFLDKWKASPELLSIIIETLTHDWFSIYGDHDLPQHSIKLKRKSGLTTLKKAKVMTILTGGHGSNKSSNKLKNPKPSITLGGKKIFLWHILTWKNELPFPGCTTSNAKSLLKKYPQFDLIVTGDNHKPFTEKHKGRLLVNVGSMLRTRADQIDYKPAVWLYYAKTNTVEKVYLPIKEGVISREHIEVVKERDERIDAFIGRLKTDFKLSMSFEKNAKRFLSRNKKTKKKVKDLVVKYLNIKEDD